MRKFDKKLLVSALVFSASAHAGSFTDNLPKQCLPGALCADNSHPGFYASVTGSWLQPSETEIGMVTDSWQIVNNGTSTVDEDRSVDPDYEFEGGFTIGYDIQDSANSIELNYQHLSNSTKGYNPTNGEALFTSYFFPGANFVPTPDFVSDATLKYEVDHANLKLLRTYSQFDEKFSIKPALGIDYARLKHDFTFMAPGYVRSDFTGFGPMLSLDGSYKLGNNFGITGYLGSSMLVGHSDADSYLGFGGDVKFLAHDLDRMVTTLSGRVGVNYNYAFSNMNIFAEVGYQATEYFNAFDMIRGNITLAPSLMGLGIDDIITTNFAVNGPYLKIGIHV